MAIASGETWPKPSVSLALTITFSGVAIATHESWPTPIVRGGIQYVNLSAGIPSGERWFPPSVTGGRQGTFLFIGGADFTEFVASQPTNPCRIESQTIGRWKATFDLIDNTGTLNPQLGQTVLITDFGRREFAGCIQNIVWDRYLGENSATPLTRFHITASDKSSICDHRIVTGKVYTAGSDVQTVIQDIVTNYLNGEGILTYGVPGGGVLGSLDSDLSFNFVSVTQAFDQIALLSGTVWWIDVNGVLNFSSLNDLPAAPFSLGALTNNYRGSQSGAMNTGGGLVTTRTTTNYYNKLYAVSNLNILPGSGSGGGSGAGGGQTETFTFTVGQPGVRSAIDPNTNLPYAQAILTSTGIGAVLSMTVNGAPQTVVDIAQYAGQQPTGPNDHLWFFFQGSPAVAWTNGPVPAGAAISITYVPFLSQSASIAQYGQAITPVNPSGQPLGTCGSGVYEGVIQVKDISSQADLNAIALAELQRIGGVPTVVDFQTDFPGLQPGQLLGVDVPLSGIPTSQSPATQLLITSVKGVHQGARMPGGSSFFWDVQATSQLDPGNWIKWYERLVARTANPLPVLQYESATFILGGGATLSSGVSVTNPYIVNRTGLATQILLAASTPPAGQTLVLTITRNGTAIVTVSMPASTLANQLITVAIPKANQLYLFAQDVLNVTVGYQISGPSQTKASGVTLKLVWAM